MIKRALRVLRERRVFGSAALASAVLAAVAGIGLALLAGRNHLVPEKLTLALAEQPVFALIYIAQARGFLAEEGVELSVNSFELGRDALRNVLEGKADLATTYETPAVLQIYGGHPLGVITTLHTSRTSHALVARRDKGIEKPSDLAGRRIGVTPGTSTEYFLSLLLATAGLKASEATIVALEPADYEKALADGRVDALVAFNPTLSMILQSGRSGLAVFHSDIYVETSMLVGLRPTLQARREAIVRLLKAVVRAEKFALENREESLRIVIKRLEGKYPEPAIREGWDSIRPEARLDHVLLALMTEEARWFRDGGRFVAPVPDFRRAIADDLLRSVRPEAVTLVARNRGDCATTGAKPCD